MKTESSRERIEEFERVCRQRRLPVTTQRRAVFEEVLGRTDHPTADQVYDALKGRLHGLSRTTVYRTLETLVQLGVITKICHPGSAVRFDPKTRQHHHLVCLECEKVIDWEANPLDKVRWPDVRGLGFEIRDYHVHFRGVCADCRERLAGKPGAARKTGGRRVRTTERSRAKPAGGRKKA